MAIFVQNAVAIRRSSVLLADEKIVQQDKVQKAGSESKKSSRSPEIKTTKAMDEKSKTASRRRSIGTVFDYGRGDALQTTKHRLSFSGPRLEEMNHDRNAGNFRLSGDSTAMRSPDPYIYDHTFEKQDDKEIVKQDKVQKAVVESTMGLHSFRDNVMGKKTDNDNNITGEAGKKESNSAENRKPDIKRTESKTNNAAPGSYIFVPGSQQWEFQPQNRGTG